MFPKVKKENHFLFTQSLGMDNTEEEVDYAASMLEVAINKMRKEQVSKAPRLEGRVVDMAGEKL